MKTEPNQTPEPTAPNGRGLPITFGKVKHPIWFFWGVTVVLLLTAAFGYFDPGLAAVRRLIGCGLIVAGVALAMPAMWRLVDDWPRAKPQHSLDVAFTHIALAVVVLCIALLISNRSEALAARFSEPLPDLSALREWAAGVPL